MIAKKNQLSRDQASPKTSESEHCETVSDTISGQGLAKVSRPKAKTKFAKTDSRYWLARLFRNRYSQGDATAQTKDWCARVARAGRRETFNLGTPNREAAARRAQEIYGSLLAQGWDDTLVKFKPKAQRSTSVATIGEYLAELRATVVFRASTWQAYVQALRSIAAGIGEIGDQPSRDGSGNIKRDKKGRVIYLSRRDRYNGGVEAWQTKVDALSLRVLSDEALQKWKLAYLAEHSGNPLALQKAKHTVNSMIRSARSLFSNRKGRLKHLHAKLTLPDPPPFSGVSLEDEASKKYVSRVDARQLITAAKKELASDPARREQFKIFCLGLLTGLRKREIDTLTWAQVDFERRQIVICRTEYFEPKSKDSEASVDCDAELLDLLHLWHSSARGPFVVESKHKARYHKAPATYYRAQEHFQALYGWLKSQGIKDQKPLHTLRKEVGSILANDQGIFAAQQVLRHKHIATTAKHYTDKRVRMTAGLGALLFPSADLPTIVPFVAPSDAAAHKNRGRKGA
jgi:integrase